MMRIVIVLIALIAAVNAFGMFIIIIIIIIVIVNCNDIKNIIFFSFVIYFTVLPS